MNFTTKQRLAAAAVAAALLFGSVSAPAAIAAAQAAEVQAGVNMRTAPSVSASVIRLLKKGEQLSVIEKVNAYWYKVKDSSGRLGFISASPKYVSLESASVKPSSAPTARPSATASETVEKVIAAGMKYLGTPYEYGSSRSTTDTFDCSDFVRQAFLDGAGIKLPADSGGQGQYVKNKGGAKTDWRQLKRGDLVFFMSYKGSKASAYSGVNKSAAPVSHDAIYLGDGKLLHTYSKESGGVTMTSFAGTHWEYRFLFGGSAL